MFPRLFIVVMLIAALGVAVIPALAPAADTPAPGSSPATSPATSPASSHATSPGQPAGQSLSPQEAARLEGKFLANARQITFDGKCGEGYFSPDQRKIIFQSIRGKHPFYQIFIKDLATGQEKMVSTGFGRTTCSWFAPDGSKILFASSHLDPHRDDEVRNELARLEELRRNPGRRSYTWSFDPWMEIFSADPDGSNLKRLTDSPGYDAEGSFSPDGKHIIFCSFRNGNGDIYIMDADGSNVRQITDSPGYDGGPFFSPDGKRIIFRGETRRRNYLQLFVTSVDGRPGSERQLTDNDAVNWGPYWHPDGKHIIYATSLHGHYNYELYLMDVITGVSQRVTHSSDQDIHHAAAADVLPVFSPDGKHLMWTSKRGKGKTGQYESELWMADWVYPMGDK